MKVKVRVPGTCGEWIQTFDANRKMECLVSAPINLYNELFAYEAEKEIAWQSQQHLLPKSKLALKVLMAYYNLSQKDVSNIVFCRGEMALSIGKGMASSTADIAGLMKAVTLLKNIDISESELLNLCTKVEPSDGTMLSGIHLIDHLGGGVLESYSDIPKTDILMLLPHSIYETEKLRMASDYPMKLKDKSSEPLELFREGIAQGDLHKIGQASTLSLLENENILPKRHLAELIELANTYDSYGILGGHSGTVAGILLKNGTDVQKLAFDLDKTSLSGYYSEMTIVQTIGGGLTYEVTEA